MWQDVSMTSFNATTTNLSPAERALALVTEYGKMLADKDEWDQDDNYTTTEELYDLYQRLNGLIADTPARIRVHIAQVSILSSAISDVGLAAIDNEGAVHFVVPGRDAAARSALEDMVDGADMYTII